MAFFKKGSSRLPIFGYFSNIIIALVSLAGGIFCLASNAHIASDCTYKVEAEVTDIREKADNFSSKNKKKPTIIKRAYFTFEYNGVTYEDIKNSSGSNEDLYEIGETVTLYINPDDPTKVYCPRDKKSFMIVGIGFIIVGVVFSVITIFKFRNFKSDIEDLKDIAGKLLGNIRTADISGGASAENDYNYRNDDR